MNPHHGRINVQFAFYVFVYFFTLGLYHLDPHTAIIRYNGIILLCF